MRSLSAILVAAAALSMAACIDLEEEFTLNPDGSGRVVIKSIFAPTDIFGTKSKDPDDMAKKAVRDELEKAQGIDAWKDVTWTLQDDGKVRFQGTAYFKDISKVKFHHQGMSAEFLQLKLSKGEKGEVVIDCPTGKKADKAPAKLTEDEIKKKMKSERAQYQQMKPMLDGMLGALKVSVKANLPARVTTVTNFKKAGDSGISLAMEGKAFAKAFDDFMMDDALLRGAIESGMDFKKSEGGPPDAFVQKLFGESGPIRAICAADAKPLFDYESEAAAARAGQPAIFETLGVSTKTIAPPAQGDGFKSIKVAAIRIVHVADAERGISPFNSSKAGVSLSIVAEFSGTVLSVKEGSIEKAVADDGTDLLPENDWGRKINWPRLTSDKTGVVFELDLGAPGEKSKGIKEVSGKLLYTVGGKTKDVDLGISEFKEGAAGKLHGAKIKELKNSEYMEGHQGLQLELEMSNDDVQGVTFLDEAGKTIEVERQGYFGSDNSATLSFSLKGAFPAKGRIVLKIYDDLKQFEVPFTISNIDFTGRPAK